MTLSVAYPFGFATVGWIARAANIELLKLGGARSSRRSEVNLFMLANFSIERRVASPLPSFAESIDIRFGSLENLRSAELPVADMPLLVAVATRPLLRTHSLTLTSRLHELPTRLASLAHIRFSCGTLG